MTVRVEDRVIHLEGACGVEEAEALAALFEQGGDWEVDLSDCGQLHASLAQALLIFRARLRGRPPEDVFFKDFLFPALDLTLKDG